MATKTITYCDWCGDSVKGVETIELEVSTLNGITHWEWEYDLCHRCRMGVIIAIQGVEERLKLGFIDPLDEESRPTSP